MRRNLILCFLVLICNFQLKSNLSLNETKLPPIILILDGSGSMWGQVDGKAKITIAREVVGNLVDKMDPSRAIGLVAYGHRKKGDCQDIENIVDPAVDNHDEIKAALQKINPIGKTPLANTALKVIEKLKQEQASATVILVSDGAESCGGDLCKVVKAAKEAGVDFVLHIVGFDIGESDKLALECAAKEGDGVYLDAANGDELSAALEQATEINEVAVEELNVRVKVTKDSALHDAIIKVFRDGEKDSFDSKRSYENEKTNPAPFSLAAGKYHFKVELIGKGRNVEEQWQRDIVIEEGETKALEFNFSVGEISIKTTANEKELWDCVVHIRKAGDKKNAAGGRTYRSSSSNPMIKELTPGLYDVDISPQKIKGVDSKHSFKNVAVKAGERLELVKDFDYGELSIKATNNGVLWDCVISVLKVEDGGTNSVGGGRTYKSPSSNPMKQIYTPGIYNIEYKAHHIHGTNWKYMLKNIEVKAGEKAKAEYDYKTGIVRLKLIPKGELKVALVSIKQGKNITYSKRISIAKIKDIYLLPGTYEVSVKPIKFKAAVQHFSITVNPGKTIEKTINF